MAEKTDLNISPYYDDYSEDKNFQKVLYRAGRPLQARELTQSQSILQNQIERFGDHFFKEGSIVSGAQCDVDMNLYFVKVKSANPNASGDANIETFRTASHGLHIQGKTSGVVAKIITSSAETTDDKATLFVYYLQQGTNSTNDFAFTANEELQLVTLDGSGNVSDISTNNNDFQVEVADQKPNGRSSIANISEGVVFSRGFFLKVDKQELILEKYSGKPSYKVGLSITETFVGSAEDSTLLDNATGTSNENAAGADRFKVALKLTKQTLVSSDDTNFIELTRVNQGIIELHVNRPMYNEIENTLARRTFDANGDFVVKQFTQSMREHLDDTTNRGFYTSINGGKEDKFVMQVSPGKAYVKGYEVEKIGTSIIPIEKARSTSTLPSTNTPIRLGNKLRITKAHSLPEFGNESGTDVQDPFQTCELLPSKVGVQGAKNVENPIGLARVRDIVLHEGTDTGNVYSENGQWDLSMFDIKMFTQLSQSSVSSANEVSVGDRIEEVNNGVPTGTTGIVAICDSTLNLYMLHDVVGQFTVGYGLRSVGVSSTTKTNGAITAVRTYNIDRVRSIFQSTNAASRENFTADLVTNSAFVLTGTVQFTNGSTALTGFGTAFTRELKEGDLVYNPAGAGQTRAIASVTDNITATLGVAPNLGSFQGNVTRQRVKIIDQEQTASIFSWPRDWVSDHVPDQVKVRRQKTVTVSSGSFQLSVASGESFDSNDPNTDDLTIAIIERGNNAGGNAKNVGDQLNVEDYSKTAGTNTLTIGGFSSDDNDAVLKVTFTVDINTPVNRDKTLNKNRCLKVSGKDSLGNGFYGTNYDNKEISLGVSDAFRVRGIFEGVDNTPLTPNATLTVTSGSFQEHEVIIGQSSDARAVLVTLNGSTATSYFYYITEERFINTEVIAGATSSATATLSNVHAGSPDITSRYFFDDGQRDGFYDLAKLTLKSGEPVPQGSILIVFDYFTAANAGDFYDVNSYSNIDYKDIPVFSPSRVDLGGLEPDGTFELSDCVDFRPSVGQVFAQSSFKTDSQHNVVSPLDLSDTTNGARYSPLSYDLGRSFAPSRTNISLSSASAVDTPVHGSSVTGAISFYVGRIDKVFMHKTGQFMVSTGIPSLTPTKPKGIDDAIEMFELRLPPYTNSLKDIRVRSHDHRRYTMKDIGKINNRVTNLERITALSLLEKDTQTKQILDADGFDRFKSGFLVDNFRGHRVGDVNHPDYNVSIDAKLGAMRPKSYSQFFDIELDTNASNDYTQTGDLITLPFSQISYVNQDKASRQLNVNPYHVFAFDGQLKLTPGTDIWQDTEQLPEVRVNREGNFDAVIAGNGNALGTVWNNWQTTWAGEPSAVSSEVQATSNGSWSGDPAQGGEWVAGLQVTREITETPETQTRTGVTTSVVEDFVETRNDRVVSVSMIPFMRARTIEIDATNLKPGSNHFCFFDNMDVNKFVRPFSAEFSQDGGTTVTSGLKTNGNGRCRAFFELPNNNSQRFPSGMREMFITSSSFNLSNPASSASVIYQAQGLLQSSQTEIVSTRNGRVITERTRGERQFTRRGENINATEWDSDAPEIPVDTIEPVITDPIPDSSPFVPPVEEPQLPIQAPIQPPQLERFPALDFTDRRFITRLDGGGRGGWKDPLAQSFMCEPQGGMFMSSIDLYFASKSDNLPVSVEIRNMVNGYPGQVILPFSVVVKNPGEINTSADGSVATTFTFESPVYIEEGAEMCFVVLSNSNDYEVFISRMGEPDIITGETISGQPYAGSLFLSQNASTWTAEQTDDMKFDMKICSFDVSKTPDLRFNNAALPTHKLQNNPVESMTGKNFVKVYNYSHGMYTPNSSVVLAGLTGDKQGSALTIDTFVLSGTPSSSVTFNDVTQDSTDGSGQNMVVSITTDGSGAISSVLISDPGQGHAVGDVITFTDFESTHDLSVRVASIGDTLGGVPIDSLNKTFTAIKEIGIDSFCVTPDVSAYHFVSGYTAPASTVSGGSVATSTRNYYFDTLHTMIPSVQFKNTRIYSSVYMSAMQSPEGYNAGGTNHVKKSITEFITINDNSHFGSSHVVSSPVNESAYNGGAKSFTAQLQLQSFNPNLSPVIDIGTLGAIGIMNRLNNIDSATSKKLDKTTNSLPDGTVYVASTEPEGDNNVMVYCTRKVNLKTPATALRVTADLFKPVTTDIKFMFKILKNDESSPWDDLGWEFFNTDGSPDATLESDARNFKEYDYTAEGLAEFSSFAIKVVGQGTNTAEIPLVAALRCIALAT